MKVNKIYIEITNRCNLSCSFCGQSKQLKRDMSVEEFTHIIHSIKHITRTIYLHVKGEPLLHPQLEVLLNICEDENMRVNITTNGTLLKLMHEKLSSFHCIKKLNISLHCEHNDGNYLDTIFTCVEKLRKHMYIVYRIWTLEDHELDEVSKKIVERMVEYYHLKEHIKEDLYTQRNVEIADHLFVDKDNMFDWPSLALNNEIEEGYCFALKSHFAILVDGSVVPCCLDGEGVINLGNIHTQKIMDILESERYTLLKKSFQMRKPCEELCKKCSFKLRF